MPLPATKTNSNSLYGFDPDMDIVSMEDFKLVYQGGHHNVYCNGKEHLQTNGGKGHPNIKYYARVRYRYKCDCESWRHNGNCC